MASSGLIWFQHRQTLHMMSHGEKIKGADLAGLVTMNGKIGQIARQGGRVTGHIGHASGPAADDLGYHCRAAAGARWVQHHQVDLARPSSDHPFNPALLGSSPGDVAAGETIPPPGP